MQIILKIKNSLQEKKEKGTKDKILNRILTKDKINIRINFKSLYKRKPTNDKQSPFLSKNKRKR